MSVYFVTCRAIGVVKIGFSDNPRWRFSKMQSDCPVLLQLEAEIPGTVADEALLHDRFSNFRLRGEWFHICPAIDAMILAASAVQTVGPTSIACNDDMTDADLLTSFGSITALARALGVPMTTVHSWKRKGIPAGRRAHIMLLLQMGSAA